MFMGMYLPVVMMVLYLFLFLEIRFKLVYHIKNWKFPTKIEKNPNRKEFYILIQVVFFHRDHDFRF